MSTPPLAIYDFGWARATSIGLFVADAHPTWKQYDDAISYLLEADNASQWCIGDAYNFGLLRFKDRDATQPFTARKVVYKTIQNYAWVCGKYGIGERHYPPSFSHHAIVAKLPKDRRRYWLQLSVDEDLTCEALDEMTAQERGLMLRLPDPVNDFIGYYNKAIEAWKRLPATPEKEIVRRGLVLIEDGIARFRARREKKAA